VGSPHDACRGGCGESAPGGVDSGGSRAAGSVWPIYVIVFLVFLVTLVSNAAKMAVIPNLVATHQFAPRQRIDHVRRTRGTIAGIVLGGLVIDWGLWSGFGWTGYEAAFYLDGVSFAFSALMLPWRFRGADRLRRFRRGDRPRGAN